MKSKALLISLVVGAIYAVYLVMHFGSAITGAGSDGEAAAGVIATALVMPHMILVILAVIFNAIGYFAGRTGFALTGAILYAVAAAVFMLYAVFLIVPIICSFVGYGKLKKLR